MINFLEKRIQKSLNNFKSKHTITEENIVEVIREIKMALLEADVNLMVVKEFIKNVKEKAKGESIATSLNPSQQMVKIVRDELQEILGGKTKEVSIHPPITTMMLVGLQGSGKTTSAAKIVNFLRKKKKISKPLLVAADVYRPAAVEQLKTLARQIGIDVFSKDTKFTPQQIVKEALQFAKDNGHDFLLIDTAGRLSIDEKLMAELVDIKSLIKPDHIIFTLDSLSGQDAVNVAKVFNEKLSLTGAIITKLDSDARGGAAFSISKILGISILFVGTGEKISNLDVFHPDRMAERILGMGDVLSLIEQAQDVIDEKDARKMTNRMFAGKFDLDDLMMQLEQVKKMGKFSKILKMIPGAAGKISGDQIATAEKKMHNYQILMSSMTLQERKNPKLLKQASRKNRIIKGSGRSAQEYNLLVNEFDRMQKQIKEMSKSIKNGSFNPSMMRNLGNI